jgi:hypothetical protein
MDTMKDDEDFFQQLQSFQNNGELTRESFNEMLQKYLSSAQTSVPAVSKKRHEQANKVL